MRDDELMKLEVLEGTHWWYLIRKYILLRTLRSFTSCGEILDIGSATGGNATFLSSKGFDVTSLEKSLLGYQIQKSKGIKVVQGDLTNLPFQANSFSTIICLDVLEHVFDDSIALQEICRVLKPDGNLLIAVPEDMNLWSQHDVAVGHFRRYSREGLKTLVKSSGLTIEKVWSTNVFLKSVVKMKRKRSRGSDLQQLNPLINWVLLAFSYFDLSFGKYFKSGMTIWLTASKTKLYSRNI